jgi:hypothetical protein
MIIQSFALDRWLPELLPEEASTASLLAVLARSVGWAAE